jgi:hypothetical protein
MSRKPGPERNPDLRREIRRIAEKCGCPVDRCREYVRFGLEFHRTLVRPPLPDFDRPTKQVVMKWFRRGLSGKLLALVGHEIVRRTFPEPEARHGPA